MTNLFEIYLIKLIFLYLFQIFSISIFFMTFFSFFSNLSVEKLNFYNHLDRRICYPTYYELFLLNKHSQKKLRFIYIFITFSL